MRLLKSSKVQEKFMTKIMEITQDIVEYVEEQKATVLPNGMFIKL